MAKNHKDAITALGQARLYAKPQDLKRIDEMVAEQKKAMNAGSLFDLMSHVSKKHEEDYSVSCSSILLIVIIIVR